jgi:hypothetical protein
VSHPINLGRQPIIIVRDGPAVVFRAYVPVLGDVHDRTAALVEWGGAKMGAARLKTW